MHIKMREKGVKHEFRVRDGDHNWDYWRSALPSVLEFISKNSIKWFIYYFSK